MKTIGLIGGMSWESTALYYQWINKAVKARLGGLHSAKIVLISVDFAEIESLQVTGDWGAAAKLLSKAATSLEKAGADCVLICTNTMHKVAPEVEAAISIPLIHIADATAIRIKQKNYTTIGLLGTGFTMAEDFYKGRLRDKFGLNILVPTENQQSDIHRIIYEELCLGQVKASSRSEYLKVIEGMAKQGADAVILGCTEITMLIHEEHTTMPLLDTTAIHAEAAVEFALEIGYE